MHSADENVLRDLAWRLFAEDRMAHPTALPVSLKEARRLASDPADRAELARLREELDELSPPWPDE